MSENEMTNAAWTATDYLRRRLAAVMHEHDTAEWDVLVVGCAVDSDGMAPLCAVRLPLDVLALTDDGLEFHVPDNMTVSAPGQHVEWMLRLRCNGTPWTYMGPFTTTNGSIDIVWPEPFTIRVGM